MPVTRQAAHVVDPVYATPVLRAPSPAESINTEYGPDTTSMDDAGTDDEEFARRVEEQIGLRRTTWQEAGPPKPVILPRPPKDSKEEQILFERVMKNLREKVIELEDEEVFDNAIKLNPGPAYVPTDPCQRDIEVVMRSMLPPSSKPAPNTSASSYPTGSTPSYPSTAVHQPQNSNGQNGGSTFSGSRFGNLGRTQ